MKICLLLQLSVLLLLTQSVLIETNQEYREVDVNGLLKLRSVARNIDGSGNNLKHNDWGKSYTNIARRTPPRY
jgi:Animal haem peroxidase